MAPKKKKLPNVKETYDQEIEPLARILAEAFFRREERLEGEEDPLDVYASKVMERLHGDQEKMVHKFCNGYAVLLKSLIKE